MVRAQFVRGSGWASAGIAIFSAGHLSHVDLVLPDGRLLGARSDSVGDAPPGVRVRPAGYEDWSMRVLVELPATPKQAQKFYDFAMLQVGKRYDHLAIFAFALNRSWRDTEAWFCSDMLMACLEHAGLCPHLYLPTNKITPVAAATVMTALGGTATVLS